MAETVHFNNKNKEIGDVWSRIIAASIDAIVIEIPLVVATGIFIHFFIDPISFNIQDNVLWGWVSTKYFMYINFIVMSFYNVFMIHEYEATIGKKIEKLKVVKEDLEKLSFKDVILREVVGKYVSLVSGMIGYAWILFNKRNQCLHDVIAKTLVIKN